MNYPTTQPILIVLLVPLTISKIPLNHKAYCWFTSTPDPIYMIIVVCLLQIPDFEIKPLGGANIPGLPK